MLNEEIELFTKLSGEDGEKTSISRIGGFLDGYEKGKKDFESKKEELTSLEKELILKALGQYRYVASDFVGYEECQWMSATIDEISKILNLEG